MAEKLTASETLDVSLGLTTLRNELLFSTSKETGACIPADWTSNRLYAQLEADGFVVENLNPTVGFRRWFITEAGAAYLADHDVMA